MNTQLYTDKSFLARSINPRVLEGVGPTVIDQAISGASRKVDGFLSRRFKLPLLSFGDDIRLNVAEIAIWLTFKYKGGNPEGDSIIKDSYDEAMRWFELVATGKVNVDVVDSSPAATEEPNAPRAQARGARPRGFDRISDCGGRHGDGRGPWPDGSR